MRKTLHSRKITGRKNLGPADKFIRKIDDEKQTKKTAKKQQQLKWSTKQSSFEIKQVVFHDLSHFVSSNSVFWRMFDFKWIFLSAFVFHFVILPVTLHNCDFALTFIKNPLLSAKISSVFLNPKTLGEWTIMVMDLRPILQLVLQVLILFSCCVINFLSPIKRDHYPIFFSREQRKWLQILEWNGWRMSWCWENASSINYWEANGAKPHGAIIDLFTDTPAILN